MSATESRPRVTALLLLVSLLLFLASNSRTLMWRRRSYPDLRSPHLHFVPPNLTRAAERYNFFDVHPHCRFPAFSQGRCRSCWALAVAAVMSHRLCRQLGGPIVLRPSELVHCATHSSGCRSGGHEFIAWRHLEFRGLPNGSCPERSLCDDRHCQKFLSEYRSAVTFVGEDEIREEVVRNGPVTALFEMTDEFANYRDGIYQGNGDTIKELHTVEIVGWGEDAGVPFWLCQNTFGPEWGIDGLFKILRGSNHLGIEQYATAGKPLNNPVLTASE
jgi:cathepsin B